MFNPSNRSTGVVNVMKTFVRGKKQATEVNVATQKIVNQLSVLSAKDVIKHRTIMNAWKLVQRRRISKQAQQLQKQYESIKTAMDDLKATSPELFKVANAKHPKHFTTFPIEMRVPTDFPPNKPWIYNYDPRKSQN
ncbi:MRPL28 54S ribosomal protein L28 [Candida maltosa Xu316]